MSLTPQPAQFLAECVAAGRYQSASEVVHEGFGRLEHEHQRRQAGLRA